MAVSWGVGKAVKGVTGAIKNINPPRPVGAGVGMGNGWGMTGNPNSGNVVKFPSNSSQTKHIFGNRPGHLPDTPANRNLILRTANSQSAFLGVDRFGNKVFSNIMRDGSQVWVYTRNGIIQNAGLNSAGAAWKWQTGFGLVRP